MHLRTIVMTRQAMLPIGDVYTVKMGGRVDVVSEKSIMIEVVIVLNSFDAVFCRGAQAP